MIKILNISNHNLTDKQVADLKDIYGEDIKIVELQSLKEDWGQLTPFNYRTICNSIISFMKQEEIEIAHLAGYAPAVVYMCNHKGFQFIYSHSIRDSIEVENNGVVEKKQRFKHAGWFKY